jgi:hypothetical protein
MQKHAAPNIEWFVDKPGSIITSSNYGKILPPGGESDVPLNGYWVDKLPSLGNIPGYYFGIWSDCFFGRMYTMPPIVKSGIEFTSFPPTSASDIQLIVYAGNKDPVHRPVASMQLYSFERYPNVQPELRESSAIVSKFCLGPSCEGFDRDTAAIGFNSTAYHYRSMAIGHRIETLSAEEIAIGIDNSVMRIGLSGVEYKNVKFTGDVVNSNSSTATNSYLKIFVNNQVKYIRLFDL